MISFENMPEVLTENLEAIKASDVHSRIWLENGKYIFLSAHHDENIDTEKNFTNLFTAIEFEVSREKIQAVHMLPGCTHNIINLSDTENLVTAMWANEQFDPNHPDTFFDKV